MPLAGLVCRMEPRAHARDDVHQDRVLVDDHSGIVNDEVERRETPLPPPDEGCVDTSCVSVHDPDRGEITSSWAGSHYDTTSMFGRDAGTRSRRAAQAGSHQFH